MSTEQQQPIFIVGFPRSGTTLLAGVLGAHSRMVCGPETEFFTGLEIANRGNRLVGRLIGQRKPRIIFSPSFMRNPYPNITASPAIRSSRTSNNANDPSRRSSKVSPKPI